jgi:hypothetical protein
MGKDPKFLEAAPPDKTFPFSMTLKKVAVSRDAVN